MNSARIQILRQYIDQDPEDPFNWYALALEYQNESPVEALKLFRKLTIEHESYVPTYYTLGKLLESLGEDDDAVEVFKKGIEIAKENDNIKAATELKSALDELLF